MLYEVITIRWVLVTHTHPDHSPAAMPLAERTGAELLGIPAPDGAHQDPSFRADRILGDGDVLASGEFELQALRTPGHASNHLVITSYSIHYTKLYEPPPCRRRRVA